MENFWRFLSKASVLKHENNLQLPLLCQAYSSKPFQLDIYELPKNIVPSLHVVQ